MYLSGITSTAQFNGTELPTTNWDVESSATLLRYVNSKTGLHPVYQSTTIDATFSVGVDFDPTNQPFAAPMSAIPGQSITNVQLNLDGVGGTKYWSFPSAVIQRVVQRATREGKIMTTIFCRGSGVLTAPGGASF